MLSTEFNLLIYQTLALETYVVTRVTFGEYIFAPYIKICRMGGVVASLSLPAQRAPGSAPPDASRPVKSPK